MPLQKVILREQNPSTERTAKIIDFPRPAIVSVTSTMPSIALTDDRV